MIKGSIPQYDMTILNMCLLNNTRSIYKGQRLIELQGKIDEFTTIVGDFNIILSKMEQYSRQKISNDIIELTITTDQLDRTGVYRLLHPMTVECTFYSSSHGACTETTF